MSKNRSWSKDDLAAAIQKSFSLAQTIKSLGLYPGGSNYVQIHKYIKESGLSTKHFKGQGWNRGLKGIGKPRFSLREILVENRYFQSYKLKQRLINAKLKPAHCEQCGWAQKTTDGFLPLELDHINGNHYDNRIENLRVLCPNCHSLTPHHRGRAGKGKSKKK